MANFFVNARKVMTTSAQDVYECPAGRVAIVINCQVANVTATPEEVNVWWTDASDANAVTRLVKDVVVPGKASLAPVAGRLVLEAGDKIRAQGQTNNSGEITASVLEIA